MSDDALPELDALEGAPHPRQTPRVFGHDRAEAVFLDAHASGRLHHAWLLAGPRGIGKATLAWRIARFLLAEPAAEPDGLFGAPPPPATLDLPADHPVLRRTLALSEPRLLLLRRVWNTKAKPPRPQAVITVEEARRLRDFFALSAADGGRRVVIVDAADEMNPQAANALLKLLEEPPEGAVLLLVAHQPSALLPTIRSRCRILRLDPLSPDDLSAALVQAGLPAEEAPPALAALAGGSVGAALGLARLDGLARYDEILRLFGTLPRLDRTRALKLADSVAGRAGDSAARLDLLLGLLDLFLARLARAAIAGPPAVAASPDEAAVFARLAPHPGAGRHWAGLQAELGARGRHGRAVNLDPAALVLDIVLRIERAAAGVAAEGPA